MKTRKLFRATLLSLLTVSALVLYTFTYLSGSSAQSVKGINPAGGLTAPAPPRVTPDPIAAQALSALQNATGGRIVSHISRETGVYDFVRADGATAVLSADNPLTAPEARARGFLSQHGALVGLSAVERSYLGGQTVSGQTTASGLKINRVSTDALQNTHVKFDQTYKGVKVFGAQLAVHMNARGITAVNGSFVPGIKLSTTPKVTAAKAGQIAIAAASKGPDASLKVAKTELAVYRLGLLEGYKGRSVLAYAVEVAGPRTREQVWVNAQTGNVINQISLHADALNRIVYSPTYDPANPESNVVRREGDIVAPPPAVPTDNLYHYTGHSYNIFKSAFGRDSYDGLGITMRTVLLANDQCPNAYWNGSATNYCPDFDKDDIVAHEWGHAYTQFTHDLIYSYQSGALNESYSDIFGETIDLNNGVDGTGGLDNTQPTVYTEENGQYVPSGGGVRWRVGEDVQGLSQPAALGILRDMAFPEAFGDPSSVTSAEYHCAASDGGGVHVNSGVPNKAFTLLVDGGTHNGQTVAAIGFTRALHIYYRAMTVYQVSSTNFPQHEQALLASCTDLVGAPLNNFSTSLATGTPSGQFITAATCEQVKTAAAAVEMNTPPAQCNFQKLLDPNTPVECDGSNTIFSEDWETGNNGWTLDNQGVTADWPGTDWALKSDLPANVDGSAHSGTAAFAINPRIGEPNGGTCTPGGDMSGQFWMDSPTITIPAGASDLKMSFEHFVQTEAGFDGGNVKISVNGGPFNLVPQNQYIFNAPSVALDAAPTNTNPKAGELAWHGANEGELTGSWGTTIINLANLTSPGDTVKVRFDFGQDGCNGSLGWLVDNVRVYSCPVLEAPTLSVGSDYGDPDKDGRFTLNWTRPASATGPDTIQESTSCGPVFTDDAETTLVAGQNSKWAGSEQWASQPNPGDSSTAYYIPDGALQNESLTMKNAVAIPAGASSTLTFTTRQGLEDGFDFGKVEVSSDGGTNFVEVASYTGPEGALLPTDVFEGTRTVNLSQFAGQSIKVRFRMTSDAFNVGQQAGWYVDNIAITASNFQTVVSGVTGTSHTFTNKPDGNFCYRVGTAYTVGPELASSPFSNVVNINVANVACLTNVAASSSGATATASSTSTSRNYAPSGAIDGDRAGANWENGGGWNDGTRDVYPDWLQVNLQGSKRIRQINVYTLQNEFRSPQQPTPLMTANLYGLLDFEVQYEDGSGNWVTVPGGNITGNTLVMRTILLADEVTTTKIRVLVTNAREHFSRIVEVEAIGCDAQP